MIRTTHVRCTFSRDICAWLNRLCGTLFDRVVILPWDEYAGYYTRSDDGTKYYRGDMFRYQPRVTEWYEKFGGKDNPLTDAIMDRIAFDSYKIPIESLDPNRDVSMREVYGLDPSLAQ